LESDPNLPRFLYVLPNFQNPTGRTMSEARRAAVSALATERKLPLIEPKLSIRRCFAPV